MVTLKYKYRVKGTDKLVRASNRNDYKYACMRNDGALISMSRTYEGCVKSGAQYLKGACYYHPEYTCNVCEVEIF